jgi:hypothetical protein
LASAAPAADVLTLDQFIGAAVRHNPSYQIPARDYLIALEADKSARSLEDWNLVSSGFYSEGGGAPISTFSSTYAKSLGYSIGLEKYIAGTGTALELKHSNTRIESEHPAIDIPGIGTLDISPPEKYYISDVSLSIVQPLLKNAWGLATKNALKMSDYSVQIAEIKLSEDWEGFITKLKSEYLTWQ